jgi:hypothetical protein
LDQVLPTPSINNTMFISDLKEDRRSRKIPYTKNGKIQKLLLENCSEALMAFRSGHKVFKGINGPMPEVAIFKTDPKLKKRDSRNTQNYYTLLFDNLPSWQEYPKRSRSLICSTSYSWAKGYGSQTYLILPFDGAKFGVCPEKDIWFSFYYLLGKKSLDRMNFVFADLKLPTTTFNNFITSAYNNQKKLSRLFLTSSISEALGNAFKAKTKDQLITNLNNVFDPTENKFTTATINELPTHFTSEVWTDSEAYMISTESVIFQQLTNGDF